jgi:A/G-specific adenine glycosylase
MNLEVKNLTSNAFSTALIDWYDLNKRDLPWRNTDDPYVIWLSEIILQQTRVKQGLPYFQSFLDHFPTVETLADASEQEVLKLWQGLGYYSRARNMLVCARQIVLEYNGQFPNDYERLLKLKGVGKYTAAAIGSFAFKIPVAVIDGNVFRVLSRIFGIDDDIADSKSYYVFEKKAQLLLDQKFPDKFNQAIMEFGALHCTPKNPNCEDCIFKSQCFAYHKDLQAILPVKKKKIKKRTRFFNYCLISYENQVLVRKRGPKDIWEGMFEFLLIETEEKKSIDILLSNDLKFLDGLSNLSTCSENYKHVLTHQTIFASFLRFSLKDIESFEFIKNKFDMKMISFDELDLLPISRLTDKYLKKELNCLP